MELGGRVKGCFKKEKLESGSESPTKSVGGNLKNGISDPSKPGLNKKVNCIFIPIINLLPSIIHSF